jgi:hypothetical protein
MDSRTTSYFPHSKRPGDQFLIHLRNDASTNIIVLTQARQIVFEGKPMKPAVLTPATGIASSTEIRYLKRIQELVDEIADWQMATLSDPQRLRAIVHQSDDSEIRTGWRPLRRDRFWELTELAQHS